MPAQKKSIETLAIIAGRGVLPALLAGACEQQGMTPFMVAFHGITDPACLKNRDHVWTRPGASGFIMKTLKERGIEDLVLIGGMRRLPLWRLWPDFTTLSFFLCHGGLRAGGDHDFLARLRHFIEQKGFHLHGVHAFMNDVLMPFGALGHHKPQTIHGPDIELGLRESQNTGARDVGQAVIVKDGAILGVEDAAGTDALIRRAGTRGAILVKTCKPQQDRDMDLPAMGPDTVRAAAEYDMAGIVMHAGASLLIEPEKVVELADTHKLFVVGLDPKEDKAVWIKKYF